ncbi:MAG: transcriptional coactivator p15/PC4 family protein [Anaerolineae bacterium]|nr:transcriptional coactivator p15/PC4 family protein [Anaerolineae bacterium]
MSEVVNDTDRVIFKVGKTALVVALTEYRGEQRLDIRYHYYAADGALLPTPRGISLPVASGFAAEVVQAARDFDGKPVEFEMDSNEPLLIQYSIYREELRLDVRRHWWGGAHQLLPGKRGVSLPVGDDLALHVLEAAADLLGIAPAEPSRKAPPQSRQKKQRRGPSTVTMMKWLDEGVAEATDGCIVEPDGVCEHGCQSWLLQAGMI